MDFNIEERVEKAGRLFKEGGYNCCQAVVLAYCDLFGMDEKTAAALSSGFGGGMGRLRMTCGACSGMFMLAGLQTASATAGDIDSRTRNYEAVQRLGKEFANENGSMVCADLLGLRAGIVEPPKPSERTAEYYRSRPCAKMVESACRIYARFYNEQVAQND